MPKTKSKKQSSPKPAEEKKEVPMWACGYCGSTKPSISGDEVEPGYNGYPLCPDCMGC